MAKANKGAVFTADQFTATQFYTAEQKAKFGNQFVKFVQSGFAWSHFPKWFYTQLSNTFGHIAHFNQQGFYETFFRDASGKREFLQQCREWGCYGSPQFTFCDVEEAIQKWLKQNPVDVNTTPEQVQQTKLDNLQRQFPGLEIERDADGNPVVTNGNTRIRALAAIRGGGGKR